MLRGKDSGLNQHEETADRKYGLLEDRQPVAMEPSTAARRLLLSLSLWMRKPISVGSVPRVLCYPNSFVIPSSPDVYARGVLSPSSWPCMLQPNLSLPEQVCFPLHLLSWDHWSSCIHLHKGGLENQGAMGWAEFHGAFIGF